EKVAGIAAKLPAPELLDRVSHRFIVIAFPLWTFAIIAGAIWADEAWGRFWGWDPKEVWSFITWEVYAAYLHARATAGWPGTRAAWIGVAGFACLMVNFFAVNYLFSGLHSCAWAAAGPGRAHPRGAAPTERGGPSRVFSPPEPRSPPARLRPGRLRLLG